MRSVVVFATLDKFYAGAKCLRMPAHERHTLPYGVPGANLVRRFPCRLAAARTTPN